jgi:hypothetical protein
MPYSVIKIAGIKKELLMGRNSNSPIIKHKYEKRDAGDGVEPSACCQTSACVVAINEPPFKY